MGVSLEHKHASQALRLSERKRKDEAAYRSKRKAALDNIRVAVAGYSNTEVAEYLFNKLIRSLQRVLGLINRGELL